jgi:hypothetical protein
MNCRRRDMVFHPVMAAYLHRQHYQPTNRPLRACHPRDLLDQVTALCRYRGQEPTLNRENLDCGLRRLLPGRRQGQRTAGAIVAAQGRRRETEVR